MTTLIVSTWELPGARALGRAAKTRGWTAQSLAEFRLLEAGERVAYYGGSDVSRSAARRLDLRLVEPALDLLTRLPPEFRGRTIEFAKFSDLARLKKPTFVKPADPLRRSFDPGIYSDVKSIRGRVDSELPVLVSEPVEWLVEFRCFIHDGTLAAWSPYMSFGRPNWREHVPGTTMPLPENLVRFCDRLFQRCPPLFPQAFVMDVGMMEDRGWAVVEFNPAWCSGILGADAERVLSVVARASEHEKR